MEVHVHTKSCGWMFLASLFIIAPSWKQPRCPSTGWKGKQVVVYSWTRILPSNKKEWTTDIGNNMDQSQKNYGKWQSQSQKPGHILCDSIYPGHLGKGTEIRSVAARICVGMRLTARGHTGPWWGDGNIPDLGVVMAVRGMGLFEPMSVCIPVKGEFDCM